MPKYMSRPDWLRLEIETADDYVARHRTDDDPIQQAQVVRREREAVQHRAELASLDTYPGESSTTTTAITRADQADDVAGGQDLVGCDVIVRYPGPYGVTTIHSSITDVSEDGDDVEVAAAIGHLFPLDTVTFTDDLAEQPPDIEARPATGAVERPGWGLPTPFDAPRHQRPLAPPGTVSIVTWRAADSRRRCAEVGYGDFWTFDDPNDWYSIAWNTAHGELYTYRHKDRTVLVRAVIATRADVDALLHGWQRDQFHAGSCYDACGRIAHHLAADPTADPAGTTARQAALRWAAVTPTQPTEPPLGLA